MLVEEKAEAVALATVKMVVGAAMITARVAARSAIVVAVLALVATGVVVAIVVALSAVVATGGSGSHRSGVIGGGGNGGAPNHGRGQNPPFHLRAHNRSE